MSTATLARYDFTTVRALTVRPPWSHAIAEGWKPIENRVWAPAKLWGTNGVNTLLIHAGMHYDHKAAHVIQGLGYDVGYAVRSGGIVAVANVTGICSAWTQRLRGCDCGPWAAENQYHWQLADIHPISVVPAVGRQRLWIPDARTVAAVVAAINPN